MKSQSPCTGPRSQFVAFWRMSPYRPSTHKHLIVESFKSSKLSLLTYWSTFQELTFHLLTSRQTDGTLRAMDVLHARGQHSAVPLLDSPAKTVIAITENAPFSGCRIFPGGRTPTLDD